MGLVDSIIGAESGGDPNARNPYSSASGPGQFIDSTFLNVIRQARPDLANKSDADLLALKTDPEIGRQATEAYAQQNQAFLAKNGLPVTPGTTYLAHFAGPQGAAKVLQADPGASVADILGPAVVKANPFLQGMTAQGLQAWAAKKMGTELPQAGTSAPAVTPAPANGPSVAPPVQPIFAQPQSQQIPQQDIAPAYMPPPEQPPQLQLQPIFAARRPVNLAALRATFKAPIFAKG